jgi:hypothetical protein
MVIGRAFSGGSSIFELFVNVSLPLGPGAGAADGVEVAGVALDVAAEFEFDDASSGTPALD